MGSQMTAEKPSRHEPIGGEVRAKASYLAEVSPTSSAVIAVTVVADLQDVLAVLRTAALLARSFRTKLSIDVLGTKNLVIDFADNTRQISVKKILDLIQSNLREMTSFDTRVFVLEANLTAASFLTVGSISVRVHTGESDQRSE